MNKIFHEKFPLSPQEIALIKFVATFDDDYWVSIGKPENIEAADSLELRKMLLVNKMRSSEKRYSIMLSTYGLAISSMLPSISEEDRKLVIVDR